MNSTAIAPSSHFPKIRLSARSQRIKSEVVFGMPNQCCQGSGICYIGRARSEQSLSRWKCPFSRAWISVSPNGDLRIAFWKECLTDQYRRRYFRWNLFQVMEAYALPASIKIGLGLESFTVMPGIYEVREDERFLVVEIPGISTELSQ